MGAPAPQGDHKGPPLHFEKILSNLVLIRDRTATTKSLSMLAGARRPGTSRPWFPDLDQWVHNGFAGHPVPSIHLFDLAHIGQM